LLILFLKKSTFTHWSFFIFSPSYFDVLNTPSHGGFVYFLGCPKSSSVEDFSIETHGLG
jgi:hypothetical protein